MPTLTLNNITKSFGKQPVLDEVSITVKSNRVTAIVGESGSGKTTLLRIIAGLETPESGSVILDGKEITSLPPNKRSMGLVFQDYALFPHLTVEKNITFGVKKKKAKVTQKMLELIHLEGYEKRHPHELSGGQQQRVALARALAPSPSILLMDEPFSNLDPIRRKKLREQIQLLTTQTNLTIIIITHDIEDALDISDSIVILKEGQVIQEDAPTAILESPISQYVKDLTRT